MRTQMFRCQFVLAATLLVLPGCLQKVDPPPSGATSGDSGSSSEGALSGSIRINGSSTVFPVSQAVGVEFDALHPDVDVTVSGAGTGSGFKDFVVRQIDLWDASRPITEDEKKQCEEKDLKYVEFTVAIDGLSVVVHPENNWVDDLSVAELHALFRPESQVMKWSDLREGFPAEKIKLYTPDSESGTYDYFNEVINGKAKSCRSDVSPSTNDNILVSGVSGDKYSLGYFGYAYYTANKAKLKALGIRAADDAPPVAPTDESIETGEYRPLSRPLFVYASHGGLKRPEVREFLKYYLGPAGQEIVAKRGYIPLKEEVRAEMMQRLDTAIAEANK